MLKLFALITGIIQIFGASPGVNSLQPVATYKTIVTDARLKGEWTDGKNLLKIELLPDSKILREDSSNERKVPLGENKEEVAYHSKAYSITIRENGIDYILVGSLSRINDQLFMDIMSLGINDNKSHEDGSGFEFTPHYLPTYNIAAITFTDKNTMSIKLLNGAFLKEQISQGNMRLKYEKDRLFDSFLLTASSFELRQFLEKYGHDERLYYKETTILTRKG